MTQTENLIPANNNFAPSSESGKGQIFDAMVEKDITPEVQRQIDATESLSEKVLGINLRDIFFKINPGERVIIMDMRKHPEDYVNNEVKPLLDRIDVSNANHLETKKAA